MKRHAWAAVGVLALALPAYAAAPVPYLPVPKGAAVILDTGSTNTAGYRIVVQRSGSAEYIAGATRATGNVPADTVAKFFDDIGNAMPLSKLPIAPCMKSASFGTSRFVWWHGQRSPDITCPGAPALSSDVAAIAGALGIPSLVRSGGAHTIQMLPNEPRKPLPSPGH
jgi:hypothetical protein